MSETKVEVVKPEEVHRYVDRMERHPGLMLRELVGPEAKIPSAGPIIGIYDAVLPPGEEYWPRENEKDVDRLVYVQSGEGRLTVGDEKHILKPEGLARIHQSEEKEARIRNTGEDRLKLLLIIFKNEEKSGWLFD